MDKETKDYLFKKMCELRIRRRKQKSKNNKKFTKKNNWKEFRASINKEK